MEQDHSFKVTNGYGDSFQTNSWKDACEVQYRNNRELTADGHKPIWKIWILDVDGVGALIVTQI